MASKEQVLKVMAKGNDLSPSYIEWVDSNFDNAHRIADYAKNRMPGIGFWSTKKRLNAFYSICEVVGNEMKKEGRNEDWAYAQLILQIIRSVDANFDTSAETFSAMARHLKPNEVELLPELAITYAIRYQLGIRI